LKKKTQRKSYHHRVPGSKLELLVTGAFRRNSQKRRAAFSLAKEVPSAYREMDARNDIPGGNPKTAIAGL
jgi:hypothetical protein